MADYHEEMSWGPLDEDGDTRLIHFARMLYNIVHATDGPPGEWPRLPPPASKEAVSKLKVNVISKEGEKCPVCLKQHKVGENVTVMPCDHTFHPDCLLTWLEKTNSCPLCRLELPTDDLGYEEFKKERQRTAERAENLENLHNMMFS